MPARLDPHFLKVGRDGWEFPYGYEDVLKAARAKHRYHAQRLKFWEREFAKLRKALGSTISLSDAEEFMSAKSVASNYHRPQLQIEPRVREKLEQAISKVSEHRGHVQAYAMWEETLRHLVRYAGTGDAILFLTFEDVKFFGVHDKPVREADA